MRIANIVAWVLLLIGGLNWLFVGLFAWNFVTAISFGVGAISTIIYVLVGLSAIWLLAAPFMNNGRIALWYHD